MKKRKMQRRLTIGMAILIALSMLFANFTAFAEENGGDSGPGTSASDSGGSESAGGSGEGNESGNQGGGSGGSSDGETPDGNPGGGSSGNGWDETPDGNPGGGSDEEAPDGNPGGSSGSGADEDGGETPDGDGSGGEEAEGDGGSENPEDPENPENPEDPAEGGEGSGTGSEGEGQATVTVASMSGVSLTITYGDDEAELSSGESVEKGTLLTITAQVDDAADEDEEAADGETSTVKFSIYVDGREYPADGRGSLTVTHRANDDVEIRVDEPSVVEHTITIIKPGESAGIENPILELPDVPDADLSEDEQEDQPDTDVEQPDADPEEAEEEDKSGEDSTEDTEEEAQSESQEEEEEESQNAEQKSFTPSDVEQGLLAGLSVLQDVAVPGGELVLPLNNPLEDGEEEEDEDQEEVEEDGPPDLEIIRVPEPGSDEEDDEDEEEEIDPGYDIKVTYIDDNGDEVEVESGDLLEDGTEIVVTSSVSEEGVEAGYLPMYININNDLLTTDYETAEIEYVDNDEDGMYSAYSVTYTVESDTVIQLGVGIMPTANASYTVRVYNAAADITSAGLTANTWQTVSGVNIYPVTAANFRTVNWTTVFNNITLVASDTVTLQFMANYSLADWGTTFMTRIGTSNTPLIINGGGYTVYFPAGTTVNTGANITLQNIGVYLYTTQTSLQTYTITNSNNATVTFNGVTITGNGAYYHRLAVSGGYVAGAGTAPHITATATSGAIYFNSTTLSSNLTVNGHVLGTLNGGGSNNLTLSNGNLTGTLTYYNGGIQGEVTPAAAARTLALTTTTAAPYLSGNLTITGNATYSMYVYGTLRDSGTRRTLTFSNAYSTIYTGQNLTLTNITVATPTSWSANSRTIISGGALNASAAASTAVQINGAYTWTDVNLQGVFQGVGGNFTLGSGSALTAATTFYNFSTLQSSANALPAIGDTSHTVTLEATSCSWAGTQSSGSFVLRNGSTLSGGLTVYSLTVNNGAYANGVNVISTSAVTYGAGGLDVNGSNAVLRLDANLNSTITSSSSQIRGGGQITSAATPAGYLNTRDTLTLNNGTFANTHASNQAGNINVTGSTTNLVSGIITLGTANSGTQNGNLTVGVTDAAVTLRVTGTITTTNSAIAGTITVQGQNDTTRGTLNVDGGTVVTQKDHVYNASNNYGHIVVSNGTITGTGSIQATGAYSAVRLTNYSTLANTGNNTAGTYMAKMLHTQGTGIVTGTVYFTALPATDAMTTPSTLVNTGFHVAGGTLSVNGTGRVATEGRILVDSGATLTGTSTSATAVTTSYHGGTITTANIATTSAIHVQGTVAGGIRVTAPGIGTNTDQAVYLNSGTLSNTNNAAANIAAMLYVNGDSTINSSTNYMVGNHSTDYRGITVITSGTVLTITDNGMGTPARTRVVTTGIVNVNASTQVQFTDTGSTQTNNVLETSYTSGTVTSANATTTDASIQIAGTVTGGIAQTGDIAKGTDSTPSLSQLIADDGGTDGNIYISSTGTLAMRRWPTAYGQGYNEDPVATPRTLSADSGAVAKGTIHLAGGTIDTRSFSECAIFTLNTTSGGTVSGQVMASTAVDTISYGTISAGYVEDNDPDDADYNLPKEFNNGGRIIGIGTVGITVTGGNIWGGLEVHGGDIVLDGCAVNNKTVLLATGDGDIKVGTNSAYTGTIGNIFSATGDLDINGAVTDVTKVTDGTDTTLAGTITITTNANIGRLFAHGYPVVVDGGTVGSIYAGGRGDVTALEVWNYNFGAQDTSGTARQPRVTVTSSATATNSNITNIFGGGYEQSADMTQSPLITINGGRVTNIYGGGHMGATVTGSPAITITAPSVTITNVFNGGYSASVAGAPRTVVNNGNSLTTVVTNLYGGGRDGLANPYQANVTAPTNTKSTIQISTSLTVGTIYGGGLDGTTNNITNSFDLVVDNSRTLTATNVYLGGYHAVVGTSTGVGSGDGTTNLSLTGTSQAVVANIHGGGYSTGTGTTTHRANITVGGTGLTAAAVTGNIYAGGANNTAATTAASYVYITGGTVNGNVYGGGHNGSQITGTNKVYSLPVNGGAVTVYNSPTVLPNPAATDTAFGTLVQMDGGTVSGNMYGGGHDGSNAVTQVILQLQGGTLTGSGGVYSGAENGSGNVTRAVVQIEDNILSGYTGAGGSGYHGGGEDGTSEVVNAWVNVLATIQDVTGPPARNVRSVYGGGLDAKVQNAVVTLDTNLATVPINGSTNHGGVAIFGGSRGAGEVTNATIHARGGLIQSNIYAGGYSTGLVDSAIINLGDANTNPLAWSNTHPVYGGSHGAGGVNTTVINVNTTVNDQIYGGSDRHGGDVGSSTINVGQVAAGTVNRDIHGDSNLGAGDVGTATINVGNQFAGIVDTNVFGGANGDDPASPNAVHQDGDVNIANINIGAVTGGTAAGTGVVTGHVYGGSQNGGSVTTANITIGRSTGAATTGRVGGTTASVPDAGNRNVFGGGLGSNVTNANIIINNASSQVNGHVYGGGSGVAGTIAATDVNVPYPARFQAETFKTDITMNNGAVAGNVFGGGLGGAVPAPAGYLAPITRGNTDPHNNSNPATWIKLVDGTVARNVYGGGNNISHSNLTQNTAPVSGATLINMTGGQVVGYREDSFSGTSDPAHEIAGGIYGGGWANPVDVAYVNIGGGMVGTNTTGTATTPWRNVYGGSRGEPGTTSDATVGTTYVTATSGTVTGHIFGGGYSTHDAPNTATVTTSNVTINGIANLHGHVFGGGQDNTVGNTNVNIQSGTVNQSLDTGTATNRDRNVYGGGYGSGTNQANVTTSNVTMTGGTVTGNVYGGGMNFSLTTVWPNAYQSGATPNSANVDATATVTVSGGTVQGYRYSNHASGLQKEGGGVYGGGYDNTVNTTVVSVIGTAVVGSPVSGTGYESHVFGGGIGTHTGTNTAGVTTTQVNVGTSPSTTTRVSGNVYGGGTGAVGGAPITGTANVEVSGPATGTPTAPTGVKVWGNVYGGGDDNTAANTVVDITGAHIGPHWDNALITASKDYTQVYGGGVQGNNVDHAIGSGTPGAANIANLAKVTVTGGYISGNVFGGGVGTVSQGAVTGTTEVTIRSNIPLIGENVFGGGHQQPVTGRATTLIDDLSNNQIGYNQNGVGNVYGGGLHGDETLNNWNVSVRDTKVTVQDTTETIYVYGGGYGLNATVIGTIDGTNGTDVLILRSTINRDVYGGGASANTAGTNRLNSAAHVVSQARVTVTDSTINGNVFGGGDNTTAGGGYVSQLYPSSTGDVNYGANVGGTNGGTTVIINDSAINTTAWNGIMDGNVFGGGNNRTLDALHTPTNDSAHVTGDAVVRLNGATTIAKDVFGGGDARRYIGDDISASWGFGDANAFNGDIDGNAFVYVGSTGDSAPLVRGNLFGGGYVGNITGKTEVHIFGTVYGNAYGGGIYSHINSTTRTGTATYLHVYDTGDVGYDITGRNPHLVLNAQGYGGHIYGGSTSINPDDYYLHVPGGVNVPAQVARFDGPLDLKAVYGNTYVEVNGKVGSNIYGGGQSIDVVGSTYVLLQHPDPNSKAIARGDVFGGGANADVEENTEVIIARTGFVEDGNVYGGGLWGHILSGGGGLGNGGLGGGNSYGTWTEISGEVHAGSVYGGGYEGNVVESTYVTVTRNGEVLSVGKFGAGSGGPGSGSGNHRAYDVGSVYGGGFSRSNNTPRYEVIQNTRVDILGHVYNHVHGGGMRTDVIGNGGTLVNVYGDTTSPARVGGNVYGGGRFHGDVTGQNGTEVNIYGHSMVGYGLDYGEPDENRGYVFGGGYESHVGQGIGVEKGTLVNIMQGAIVFKDVFGGSYGGTSSGTGGNIYSSGGTEIHIDSDIQNVHYLDRYYTIGNNVYGGGYGGHVYGIDGTRIYITGSTARVGDNGLDTSIRQGDVFGGGTDGSTSPEPNYSKSDFTNGTMVRGTATVTHTYVDITGGANVRQRVFGGGQGYDNDVVGTNTPADGTTDVRVYDSNQYQTTIGHRDLLVKNFSNVATDFYNALETDNSKWKLPIEYQENGQTKYHDFNMRPTFEHLGYVYGGGEYATVTGQIDMLIDDLDQVVIGRISGGNLGTTYPANPPIYPPVGPLANPDQMVRNVIINKLGNTEGRNDRYLYHDDPLETYVVLHTLQDFSYCYATDSYMTVFYNTKNTDDGFTIMGIENVTYDTNGRPIAYTPDSRFWVDNGVYHPWRPWDHWVVRVDPRVHMTNSNFRMETEYTIDLYDGISAEDGISSIPLLIDRFSVRDSSNSRIMGPYDDVKEDNKFNYDQLPITLVARNIYPTVSSSVIGINFYIPPQEIGSSGGEDTEDGGNSNPDRGTGTGSSGGTSGGGGGLGGLAGALTTPNANPSNIELKEADAVKRATDGVKQGGAGSTVTISERTADRVLTKTLRAMHEAAVRAGGRVMLNMDTMNGTVVEGRMYIDPSKAPAVNGTILTRVYTRDSKVSQVKAFFQKYFRNNIAVIHMEHKGSLGMEVQVAAKVNLSGMNTNNLVFYVYDTTTNNYRRIANPRYTVDNSGYLRFYTSEGGDIIVSDGLLQRK